mmetsp:Transcript_17887/g.40541  ORF Transcript_17887/g.40541 Transcript_17887/m.40541 type:complete len:209 (-) Transcript_17887:237-863(-)
MASCPLLDNLAPMVMTSPCLSLCSITGLPLTITPLVELRSKRIQFPSRSCWSIICLRLTKEEVTVSEHAMVKPISPCWGRGFLPMIIFLPSKSSIVIRPRTSILVKRWLKGSFSLRMWLPDTWPPPPSATLSCFFSSSVLTSSPCEDWNNGIPMLSRLSRSMAEDDGTWHPSISVSTTTLASIGSGQIMSTVSKGLTRSTSFLLASTC